LSACWAAGAEVGAGVRMAPTHVVLATVDKTAHLGPGVRQCLISSYGDAGIAAPLLNLRWDSYAARELDLQIGKSICDLVTELKNRKNKQTKKSNKTHRGISRHGNLESAKTLDYTRMYCRHIHLLIHPWKQKPTQMN
jgi:hypothetical protein